MGIVIAFAAAAVAIGIAVAFARRPQNDAAVPPLESRPDFSELRRAVTKWTEAKVACLSHDVERIRATGAFVPRLPEGLAEQSADASRVLNRLAARLPSGEMRDAVGRINARAEEIFTEEALNPGIVTERWLLDRIAEIHGLGRRAESLLPD